VAGSPFRLAEDPTAVPVRDAATVVLLRDTPAGLEAFLLQRVRAMAFAAGMTVFPGGVVDTRDADADLGWVGPPASAWSAALSAAPPLARALVCAAVRETFEESGVLLAGPTADAVCTVDGPQWEADRAALEAGEVSLAALLSRRGLLLRADLLRPWAHWITPAGERRRYDTRFFVAALPSGQSTRDSAGEADAVVWLPPAEALGQAARGERGLLPPTEVTLEEVAGHQTVAEVLAAADRRVITPIEPRLERDPDGAVVVVLPDGRRIVPLVPAGP
jgi:8-oxo-dGTP pyrophosphatase MutT (NUDIX family)